MLPMLDPNDDLAEIPDAFVSIFSGNKVFLADLPCGSGAASLTILSVLCELRMQRLLPRMPLDIVIVGGEISKYAQNYALDAIDFLRADLEAQAISLTFQVMDWDVCDPFKNSDLIKHLTLASQNCAAKLLVIANFSGFLQGDGKWKDAQKQLEELFRHSRDENSIAIWIEPQKKEVVAEHGFISRIISWFKTSFSSLVRIGDGDWEQKYYAKSIVKVKCPFVEGTFRTNMVVLRFDLPSERKI
jgi:hypothetical protein